MDEAMLKSGQFPNVAIMAGSDPKEVMREYSDCEHMDNGVSVHMCPNDTGAHSNVSQNLSDTREKLEADIRAWHRDTPFATKPSVQTLLGWLDRQAAITRRECEERLDFKAITAVANIMNADLTADRDALKEQINRFNVPKSEETAENDASKGVINNFDVQNDTREKLEADAGDVVTILRMAANGGFDGSTGNVMKNAKVLLDMPKERALDSEVFRALADMVERERAELTAERNSLRLDVAALYDMCDECKLVASLTAERDQLSRDLTAEHALVVQFEHDNEELKADLQTANDTINTLRASVAGLKETVEKLKAHETA